MNHNELTAPVDPLCRRGSSLWPSHDWSPAGVCRRCGAALPRLSRLRDPR